jgi:hypothetical protein
LGGGVSGRGSGAGSPAGERVAYPRVIRWLASPIARFGLLAASLLLWTSPSPQIGLATAIFLLATVGWALDAPAHRARWSRRRRAG